MYDTVIYVLYTMYIYLYIVGMLIPHTSPLSGSKPRIKWGFSAPPLLAFPASTWYNVLNHIFILLVDLKPLHFVLPTHLQGLFVALLFQAFFWCVTTHLSVFQSPVPSLPELKRNAAKCCSSRTHAGCSSTAQQRHRCWCC